MQKLIIITFDLEYVPSGYDKIALFGVLLNLEM